ncbi:MULTISPECIES: hypothetical protein [unclassified Chelatococcus]|jgi:hypothetical protein|uniref:hypothetical protein n=1 Tax=unclassified Chelatococcus TaxID=2638111 RepID=UPI001BD0D116|nr:MULTISPECIES: hypothetical protein [unclassified Chelatococcus]CAH1649285.1 hypothetical protein CHELA20_10367 [Hyphomicrobiales bacterium]MBS7741785.1 hypothetical protein [Chelatococcus sp. HY11]MBX3541417.1 hypothetical protein [Chelatococcus sp.]MCO5074689.1 hypothetical protein [Chelatococcus sp.]CAH1691838.1 hypothetical protein CHELA41_50595 [Hyphomicrobiales bacterium]
MPTLSSSSTEDDIYVLLRRTAELTWGDMRAAELDAAIRAASHNVKVLFSVPLGLRDSEPDYYDNASEDGGDRS